jgi:hypothetical protein
LSSGSLLSESRTASMKGFSLGVRSMAVARSCSPSGTPANGSYRSLLLNKESEYPGDAAANATSTRKLNITKASRRALSNVLRRCSLRSPPAPGFNPAIHAATVLPCVTCASAVLTVTRSSWIAASHKARPSRGDSLDAGGNERSAASSCGCLWFDAGPCFVSNAGLAVATLRKSIPS